MNSLQDFLAEMDERVESLSAWLAEHSPNVADEHRHLDDGTSERAYYHFGYLCAIRDIQSKLRSSQ